MITTTIEEWEKEYTSDEEWNTHRAKSVSEWGKITDKTIKKYVAEVKWNRTGKLIKQYIITRYEYKYDEENELIKFEILERKQYKSRNAMMNRIRKIEKKILEEGEENGILLYE